MTRRYLFGPVDNAFAEENLLRHRQGGDCLAFDAAGNSDVAISPASTWELVLSRLPPGWQPDFIVLQLYYAGIPPCLWTAPVPVIALAGDTNLLWTYYRRQLPLADLILTDPTSVEKLAREGIHQAQSANLFGCERVMLESAQQDMDRAIDILFIANLHPAVQRERMPWIARLARLSERWHVMIRQGVFGAQYRELLGCSEIVFNRSVRGECNKRAIEVAAAGALLFQEAGNGEVPNYFQEQKEYIAYGDDNLESLLDYYLEHDDERRRIAEAGQRRAKGYSFEQLWEGQLELIEWEWPLIEERAKKRPRLTGSDRLVTRVLQALGGTAAGDPLLDADLAAQLDSHPRAGWIHNALGLMVALKAHQAGENGTAVAAKALVHFQRAIAIDSLDIMAGLNLVEALLALHKDQEAAAQARLTLSALDQRREWDRLLLDAGHFPTIYDFFRVEWEQAGWRNPGDPEAEAQAKRQLIRWRLHGILGELTGELSHYYESVVARPDLPTSRAALGCALGRNRQAAQAVEHLHKAVEANPLDFDAARALYQALGEAGDEQGRLRLARARRLFAKAAPQIVPPEPWFMDEEAPQEATSDASTANEPLAIVWEGDQLAMHSLALVNRQICGRLLEWGHNVAFLPAQFPAPESEELSCHPLLRERLLQPLGRAADVHVAHQWPPSFKPPAEGHWVFMQPWEFGSLPRAWLTPLRDLVDEIWTPSRFVRDSFVQSGMPADRVQVVPNGVDSARFHPAVPAFPLKTEKKFKFLFVGGTIQRKGIDILLEAYTQAFTRDDDICLVIKDMGVGAFYKGQTAEPKIAEYQAQNGLPEIEYINQSLRDEELAGLYTACDCLVHPYRGEGFGLPIAEAMASGLPVIVTGYGAALDFCNDDNAFLLPARVVRFPEKRLGDLETVDYPWLAEPDQAALRSLLRYVVAFPDNARKKAAAARVYVSRHLTWENTAATVEERLRVLKQKPVRRPRGMLVGPFSTSSDIKDLAGPGKHGTLTPTQAKKREKRFSLCMIVKNEEDNLAACLESVRDVFDEIIIVDTGSTDRTKEIALQHGGRVFDFPWIDDFAAARNECLRYATGDWIFWMDADDRLDNANREKLARLLDEVRDENAMYVMQCLCVPDATVRTGTVVHHVRLFRNQPQIRWKYRVHEQILPAAKAAGATSRFTDIIIQHTGYIDPALVARKRDTHLLQMDHAEMPDDPFVLFNLSQAYLDLKRTAEAMPLLRRSLKLSDPTDSIVRKLYYLIVQGHRRLGERYEAMTACRAGLAVCPQDAELMDLDAQLRLDQGDEAGAEACYLDLLGSQEAPHFASVPAGLRGFQTRNKLALLYKKQGRLAEAEARWRQAVEEEPNFLPAWLGLEDV